MVAEAQEAEYIGRAKDEAEVQRLEVRQQAEEAMRQTMENEAAERVTGKVAKAMETEPAFTIKLQSNTALTQEVARTVLTWLLMHALVVLDPGDRWVMSRIVAVLTDFDLKELQCGGLLVELTLRSVSRMYQGTSGTIIVSSRQKCPWRRSRLPSAALSRF